MKTKIYTVNGLPMGFYQFTDGVCTVHVRPILSDEKCTIVNKSNNRFLMQSEYGLLAWVDKSDVVAI